MLQILLYKLGFYQKYLIKYHDLHTYQICSNETPEEYWRRIEKQIDLYYFKNCPQWILEEKALQFLHRRVRTCFGDLILIYSIGEHVYSSENQKGKYFKY